MPDKQGWTEFQKESWDAQYGNTIAQGWRFVRDTGDAGNYNRYIYKGGEKRVKYYLRKDFSYAVFFNIFL